MVGGWWPFRQEMGFGILDWEAYTGGLSDKLECLRELGETGLRGTLKMNAKGADRRT